MLYVMVAAGLAALIGIHELVVWVARRTIRRPWAVLLGPVAGYLILVACAFALYSTYGFNGSYDAVGKRSVGDRRAAPVQDTTAAVTAALCFPVAPTRELVDQIRALIAGKDQPEPGDPGRIVEVLSDAQRPAGQRALEVLLRSGFYVWLALFLLDLMRLWRLSRQPDARSSNS